MVVQKYAKGRQLKAVPVEEKQGTRKVVTVEGKPEVIRHNPADKRNVRPGNLGKQVVSLGGSKNNTKKAEVAEAPEDKQGNKRLVQMEVSDSSGRQVGFKETSIESEKYIRSFVGHEVIKKSTEGLRGLKGLGPRAVGPNSMQKFKNSSKKKLLRGKQVTKNHFIILEATPSKALGETMGAATSQAHSAQLKEPYNSGNDKDNSMKVLAMLKSGLVYLEDQILEKSLESLGGGAGKKGFSPLIFDMKSRYKISVLDLCETKVNSQIGNSIIRKLSFNKFFMQQTVGFNGGIWVLWDDSELSLEIISHRHQFVHTRIMHNNSRKVEFVTFIYASRRRCEKSSLWGNLRDLAETCEDAWMVIGDFNAMVDNSEKVGGSDFCWGSAQDFQNCLMDCNLNDLGFKGPMFTWKRDRLLQRLDRACSNERWNLEWPQRNISHLPFYGFDHRPVLVMEERPWTQAHEPKPFKFLAEWLTTEGFGEMVQECWGNNADWLDASSLFQREALEWHESVFKATQRKKNRLHARLRGIDHCLSHQHSSSLENLQRDLWKELEVILIREEITWFQRSRCDWFQFGDKNTEYFHSITVSRRRRNRIITIMDEDGRWIADSQDLINHATEIFRNLYAAEEESMDPFSITSLFPSIFYNGFLELGVCPSQEKVRGQCLALVV
ncbi:uncharacterized protein LOC133298637 [Gastrolobium bilobum]|uniref:uncharacterized protein LOC133298637 n=1 Tax=Gastrolobium bilobum TaxID=150636 RepID=UPI002AB0923F|nr:uncharacterized protein LOC133298637 [Gastrolobium bilobum]